MVQTDEMKTLFFHDAATGQIIGRHVLPRSQSQYENESPVVPCRMTEAVACDPPRPLRSNACAGRRRPARTGESRLLERVPARFSRR